jgi:YVTN family beta-propeller protein
MRCGISRSIALGAVVLGSLSLGWARDGSALPNNRAVGSAVRTEPAACGPHSGPCGSPEGSDDSGVSLTTQRRQPVALALADDGKRLFAANRRSGSVSIIDPSSRRVIGENPVGRRLSDLAVAPGGDYLLATDEGANELILLRRDRQGIRPVSRLKVGAVPVSVQWAADGSHAYVASLWSRRISIVDVLAGDGKERSLRIRQTIDMSFAPRKQLLVENGRKLLVADAFGGTLAVVDIATARVDKVHSLPAHNIRGLALVPASPQLPLPSGERVGARGSADGLRLLLAHQILSGLATANRDDVHWGNLITNNLRVLPIADVVAPSGDVLRHSFVSYLGEVGHGAGDPAGVAVGEQGNLVVSLGGVGEVALGPHDAGETWTRVKAGRRPTAVILGPDGRHAYVADTFGDAILVVDVAAKKLDGQIELGPQPELTASDRGERLFYDARLSHEGWFSCHSCHSDGHSTGLLNDNLTDRSFGTPKRILSLLGVGDTGPWAWNGSMTTLEHQIEKSIQSTMQGAKPSGEAVCDLAAFLKTLSPPPPSGRQDLAAVQRGKLVFAGQHCDACHVPPTYTSAKTFDVGLRDEAGNTAFNPPSLRGVAQGGPFFHDGRAATLEDVFGRYRHQLKNELASSERRDLVHFLRSL